MIIYKKTYYLTLPYGYRIGIAVELRNGVKS